MTPAPHNVEVVTRLVGLVREKRVSFVHLVRKGRGKLMDGYSCKGRVKSDKDGNGEERGCNL